MIALRRANVALLLTVLTPSLRAQFVSAPGSIPRGASNAGYSENVDVGDIDLDGDWDVVIANGGDNGKDQNRIWVNMGGLQGGTLGQFRDRTKALAPAILDQSRDVEFVDFDGDGDLDIQVSNTSQGENQSNRWWTNLGLAQQGQLGTYVDETAARWIKLGEPGTSIADILIIPDAGPLPGGWIDFSCDSDFADFDNDGDLDLFHSSYGISFSGVIPSRVFLNDGDGYFSEFNPSGQKLISALLPVGSPASFAQGLFRPNTTDTTGAEADVCTNTLDIDLGDVDGDLDIDVLHGDRDALPRFFLNLLEERGGTPADLAFRDVSYAIFPGDAWATGGGNYEQELGDLDRDGDLDLYGLNWEGLAGADRLFRNEGGVFGPATTLVNSIADDNEGDFVDFDNDGRIDLYVASFTSPDRLYRNTDSGAGPLGLSYVNSFPVPGSFNTLDADAADFDGDGDYDIITAVDNEEPGYLLLNVTNVPDTHAPDLFRLEAVADTTAGRAPLPVRVQVYDNTPYYVTWYNRTVLDVKVSGISIGALLMKSSFGQIFRGELPGNLVGQVEYSARSADAYGNSAATAAKSYASADVQGGSSASFGADSGPGAPALRALSVALPGAELLIGADGMTAGHLWLLTWRAQGLAAPLVLPGLGIANVGGAEFLLFAGTVAEDGSTALGIHVPGSAPAVSTFFQMFEFPGDGLDLFDSSLGLRVDIQP